MESEWKTKKVKVDLKISIHPLVFPLLCDSFTSLDLLVSADILEDNAFTEEQQVSLILYQVIFLRKYLSSLGHFTHERGEMAVTVLITRSIRLGHRVGCMVCSRLSSFVDTLFYSALKLMFIFIL